MGFSDFVADVYGASIGEFIVEKRRKARRTEAELSRYGTGEAVRLRASTYGLSPYLGSMWISGVLDVVPGLAVWNAGYFRKDGGGVVLTPATFEAEHLRGVTARETWTIAGEHVVLVGRFEKRRVEIAMFIDEIPLFLDALDARRLLD